MKNYSKEKILMMLTEIYELTSNKFARVNLHQIVYKDYKLSASLPSIMKRNGFLIEGDKRSTFKWGLDHKPTENDVNKLYDIYKEYCKINTSKYRERKMEVEEKDVNFYKSLVKGLASDDEKTREVYRVFYNNMTNFKKMGLLK